MNANVILTENQKKIDRINNLMNANEYLFESCKISSKLMNHQDNRLSHLLIKLEKYRLIAFLPQMIERGCFN